MAGARSEPPRAACLRALMLERERIANHLGDLGALGNDAAFSFGLAQFMCLKEDWPTVMELLGDVTLNPSFPDAEWEKLQPRVVAAIARQQDPADHGQVGGSRLDAHGVAHPAIVGMPPVSFVQLPPPFTLSFIAPIWLVAA